MWHQSWQNISPHFVSENLVFLLADSFQFLVLTFSVWIWVEWFSADANGSEYVHDQVHPEEVDNVEWWGSHNSDSKQNNCNDSNIWNEYNEMNKNHCY